MKDRSLLFRFVAFLAVAWALVVVFPVSFGGKEVSPAGEASFLGRREPVLVDPVACTGATGATGLGFSGVIGCSKQQALSAADFALKAADAACIALNAVLGDDAVVKAACGIERALSPALDAWIHELAEVSRALAAKKPGLCAKPDAGK